jgi:hypothetical protein
MYIDYDLRLSNAQALTASTQSSSYIDAIQSGWGANDELYARFVVTTAFTGSATGSVTFAIQIAQDTAFASVLTVVTLTKIVSQLTAQAVPLVVKLPVAMMTKQMQGDTLYSPNDVPYRYIKAYYTLGSNAAGSVTCSLVMNTPTTIDKAL